MKMKAFRNEHGYTITEMLIAIVISILLISAAAATYIAQNRSYTTQASISEINTQAKIAHDMISNDIKTAGFGVPSDMNMDPVAGNTAVITPVDSSTQPDAITIVSGYRRIGTLWPAGGGPGIVCPDEVSMGTTQVSITLSGTDGANTTDRRYVSFDGVDYAEVQNCTMSGSNCSATITLDRPLRASYPLMDTTGDGKCDQGRPVYIVEDVTYCVDANATLRRIRRSANVAACTGSGLSDNEAIAENIEDLQFAYALDTDNDGMLDGGGFINNGGIANPSDIRTVRVSILARADRADDGYAGMGNPPAAIENRNHGTTDDNFRRRWWQKIVTVRNRWGQ
jgi:Tfp pilus assembly protein PilW